MLDLSIIIISWNVADLLAACLDSVLQNTPPSLQIEIIVIESGSKDHSVQMLKARFPQVNLIEYAENIGFVRGNNIGFKLAHGRHILLLNPGTEVVGNALNDMVTYLDQHPDVGIVGPHTLNTDGTTQSTRRRFPTLATGIFEATWLQKFAPHSVLDRYYVKDQPDNGVYEVDWVQGSALMARHELYNQFGGLDEGFFMYCEELDWCHRAKLAGWKIVYLGIAQIIHHGGKSSEQIVAQRDIYFHESKLRYFRKYHGAGIAHLLRLVIVLSYIWQIGLETGKALLGHKRAMRQDRVKQYVQVLRSGLKVS
jgi:GT2 family glycosyltransferase